MLGKSLHFRLSSLPCFLFPKEIKQLLSDPEKGKAGHETPVSVLSLPWGLWDSEHVSSLPTLTSWKCHKKMFLIPSEQQDIPVTKIPLSSYRSDRQGVNVAVMDPLKLSKPNYLISPQEHQKKLQMSSRAEVRWWHLRQQVARGRQWPLLPLAPFKRVPKGSLTDHCFNQDLQNQNAVHQGCFSFIQEQQEHPTCMPK